MPITNITHSACYTVEKGVSAGDLTCIMHHTWQQSYSLYAYLSAGDRLCVCQKLPAQNNATIVIYLALQSTWQKRRGDCLVKWLIMLGFLDLRRPRVYQHSCSWLLSSVVIAHKHRSILPSDLSVPRNKRNFVSWHLFNIDIIYYYMIICLTCNWRQTSSHV